MIGTRWTLLGRLGTRLVPLRGRPLLLGGCDDARAVPCTLLGPRPPCRGLPSRHARHMYVAPSTHGATAAPQSPSVNPPQTYHATPHSTTRRHTSHPPPSPPYTRLFPPEGQGPPLPTRPAMPYPSTRSLTHPHPESSSSSPPPPPIPHRHQHRTPLFQSSDDTTPHPMRPTLAPATNGPLTLHTPHSTLYLHLHPRPRPQSQSQSHPPHPTPTPHPPHSPALERAAGWAAVPLGAGGASPSSVFRASSRSPSPCDP